MNGREKILKLINQMSGSYSPYEVYMDWIKACAISIANACSFHSHDVWESREKAYMGIVKKYGAAKMQTFAELFALLVNEYENGPTDVLSEVFMLGGMGSKQTGQFFTPYSISKLMAQVNMQEVINKPIEGKITLYEPTCGAGGMIIACADYLYENGINYQRKLKVTAQDLDWKAVYTTYVQLSLLGIDAVVAQGDTLADPYDGKNYPEERLLRTPKNVGMLL